MNYTEFLHNLEIEGYSIKPVNQNEVDFWQEDIPFYKITGLGIEGRLYDTFAYFDNDDGNFRFKYCPIVLDIPKNREEYNWLISLLISLGTKIKEYEIYEITKYPE